MKTLGLSANGEGFGHAARMVSLVPELVREYRLVLYAPITVHGFLRQHLPQVASGLIPLRTIPHLHMAKKRDRIDYYRTAVENIPVILRSRTHLARVRTVLAKDRLDALLSDFEPFTAWAATALGVPVLQLNHPGIVTKSSSIMPDALVTKWIAKLMMGPWDKRILVSFYNGDVGPMIRRELVEAEKGNDGSLVIYLKPGYRRPILKTLKALGITNYHLFPNKSKNYAQALASCKAVIAGGGHQTLSEALYLGKPILAIPQRGQYEQRLNAFMADIGGFGVQGKLRSLDKQLARFLQLVDQGAFPRKPLLPWIHYETENQTSRVLRKIHHFVENHKDRKIVPIYGYFMNSWLNIVESTKAQ